MIWYHAHENLVMYAIGYPILLTGAIFMWYILMRSKQRSDLNPNRINEVDMEQLHKDEIASYPPHGFYTNLPSPEYYEQMLNDQRRYPSSVSDTRVPPVYQDAKSWHPDALNVTKQATKPKRDKRGRYCR